MLLPRPQGRSRLFNGSSGFFNVPSADISYASPYFTFFSWYRASQLVPDCLMGRWLAGGTNDWLCIGGAGGYWAYGFANQQVNGNTGKIIPGRWQTVAFTKNGTGGDSIRGYVDGYLDAVSTTATAGNCGNSSNLEIGRAAAASSLTFWGEMAHMAIWKGVLTDQEILALHLGALPGEIRPALLFGWWPLNGGGVNANTVELDWSGRNKHASLGVGSVAQSQQYPPILAPRDLYYDLRHYTSTGGAVAPINTVAPVASGTPEVGQTLSVTDGTWTGTPPPTITYQWQYNDGSWNNIAGATSATWVVDISGAVDVGDTIRCQVTGTNAGGSDTGDSNTLGPVTDISLDPHRSMIAVG